MAVIEFTYRVTIKMADEELDKLTEFLVYVKAHGGEANLLKTTPTKKATTT